MKRLVNILLAVSMLLSFWLLASTPTSAHESIQESGIGISPEAPVLPANDGAGAAPSIQLMPSQGYSGQAVAVSGVAESGAAGVRLTWKYGGTMLSARVVTPGVDGGYQADMKVPHDAAPGAAQVCAAVTDVERAVFGCADFTIIPPPPGSVVGQLPAGVAHTPGGVRFLLLDRAGGLLLETPLAADGSFRLDSVAPGIYKTAIVGEVNPTVTTHDVAVHPNAAAAVTIRVLPPDLIDPITGSSCSTDIQASSVGLSPSASQSSARELNSVGLAEFPPPLKVSSGYDFGVYLRGVALNAVLTVNTSAKHGSETVPTYTLVSPDGQTTIQGAALSGSNHQFTGSVALGDSKISASGIWTLYVYPHDNKGTQYCPTTKTVRFLDDPMKNAYLFRPDPDSVTTWNSARQQYEFKGKLPNPQALIGVTLPLRYPKADWNLPLIGNANSDFDAYLSVQGTMKLNRVMSFTAFNAQAKATLIGEPVLDKSWSPPNNPSVVIDPNDPKASAIAFTDIKLWEEDWQTQVYQGVLASYWGIVTVKASVVVGLRGEVVMDVTFYPLVPATDTRLLPTVTPYLSIRIWVDLLLGIANAGADATGSVSLTMPFHVKNKDLLNPFVPPDVSFENPCVGVRVDLIAWARVNLGFWKKQWNSTPVTLLNENSCHQTNPSPAPPTTPPKLLSTPGIAASPDGGVLVVFIGDANPGGSSPTPKVYALYKAPGQSTWPDSSQAVALTDGTKMVQDPVVTFATSGNRAYVFWTQTDISSSDEDKADMKAILDHQEIYMARGEPQSGKIQWNGPERRTSDNVSDGRPAAAGDANGLTLAWVRANSSGYDRSQTFIAVKHMDSNNGWGPMIRLDGSGMDAQVSVARSYRTDKPGGAAWRHVVFTSNADLSAPGQRRIMGFTWEGPQRDTGYKSLPTSGLPAGAMSPRLVVDDTWNDKLMLAYLVGDPNAAAPAGSTARLQVAILPSGTSSWLSLDTGLQAEKPELASGWDQGPHYVVFRNFTDRYPAGQISVKGCYNDSDWRVACPYPVDVRQSPGPNWLPAATVNLKTRMLEVVWFEQGSQSAAELAALAQNWPTSPPAQMAAPVVTLDASVEPLKIASIPADIADPALDPALLPDPPYAAPGTTVTITATVRNVGLVPVTDLAVNLYRDQPGTRALVATRTLTQTIDPGDTAPVAWDIVADAGRQHYYAVVSGGDGDVGDVNNYAYGTLNALTQPRILNVARSYRFANALELSWEAESHAAVAGYRILRAAALDGPYQLVGETTGSTFTDLGLAPGVDYFYKVQAFDADGMFSEMGAPRAGILAVLQETATALTSSRNPSSAGQPVTFTATVEASGDNAPSSSGAPQQTGAVSFKNGGADIAGCASILLNAGQATCTTPSLPPGRYVITAEYSGDSNYNGSTSNALSQLVRVARYLPVISK